MRTAGLLLLTSGWIIVLAAIALLPASLARGAFLAAGLAVQALGLTLALRSHTAIPSSTPRSSRS